jgi:hypothetical protein
MESSICAEITMPLSAELEMWRKYRAEVDSLEREIRRLSQLRQAMWTTVQGLEQILKANGVNTDEVAATDEEEDTAKDPTAMDAVVAVFRKHRALLGAKDLQRALMENGVRVNYYTLYKTLARDAARDDSPVARFGDKFGLREWTVTDTGTSL